MLLRQFARLWTMASFSTKKARKRKRLKKSKLKSLSKKSSFVLTLVITTTITVYVTLKIFLGKRFKVRATVTFRGRQMEHTYLGRELLKKLAEELSDIADVETSPKMEARTMFTIFAPKSNK